MFIFKDLSSFSFLYVCFLTLLRREIERDREREREHLKNRGDGNRLESVIQTKICLLRLPSSSLWEREREREREILTREADRGGKNVLSSR